MPRLDLRHPRVVFAVGLGGLLVVRQLLVQPEPEPPPSIVVEATPTVDLETGLTSLLTLTASRAAGAAGDGALREASAASVLDAAINEQRPDVYASLGRALAENGETELAVAARRRAVGLLRPDVAAGLPGPAEKAVARGLQTLPGSQVLASRGAALAISDGQPSGSVPRADRPTADQPANVQR